MKRSDYSSDAIAIIVKQAADHLVFAKDFDQNKKRIELFFASEPDLLELLIMEFPFYLDCLRKDGGYDKRVYQNVGDIINSLRETTEETKKKEYFEVANKLVDCNRKGYNNTLLFQYQEMNLRSTNILDYYKFCLDKNVRTSEVKLTEIEQTFYFTEIVVNDRAKEVEKLVKREAFLRYCNLLLSRDQSLLKHRDFLNYILYALFFNKTYQYYAKEDHSGILTEDFFKRNEMVEKRIRKFAKENHIPC